MRFTLARSGRPGPVVLDFAKNAQVEKTKYEPTKVDFIRSYVPVPDMDEESVQAAAELINNAERPLVLVGQGVELGNAQSELREFIEKADMPAGCTLLGLSALPTEHPLNKGMLGMHGNLGPNINTNKCDVLIAVGMRFDDRVTGNLATYAKQAKVIHLISILRKLIRCKGRCSCIGRLQGNTGFCDETPEKEHSYRMD